MTTHASTSASSGRLAPAGGDGATLRRGRRRLTGLYFSLPFIAGFAIFGLIPIVASFVLSFTDMTVRDIRNPFSVEFVGLEQFQRLFADQAFLQSLGNTAFYVVVGVPFTLAAGMALALALDRGINRFRSFFRVGFYTPVVTSIVAIAIVWRYLLDPEGLINSVLGLFGISGPNWLNDTQLAMPALVAMAVWRGMGNMMVILLAGLQAIPPETREAAAVDGAGAWRSFWHITLPQLRPTILLAMILLTGGYLQFFEEPFVMTRGGPLGSTTSISLFVYDQFGFGKYAYGTAASYVLFVIIAALALLQFRILRSRDD